MQIGRFRDGVFAPHKFNEGERVSPTDQQVFDNGCRLPHSNDSITGDGQIAIPKEVAFYATIGAIDLLVSMYCSTE
jgi:hypothetical protein